MNGLQVSVDSRLRVKDLDFLEQADGLIVIAGGNKHAGVFDQGRNLPILRLCRPIKIECGLDVLLVFPCVLPEHDQGLPFEWVRFNDFPEDFFGIILLADGFEDFGLQESHVFLFFVGIRFSKGPINAYKSVKKLLSESFNNGLESQMEIESIHISNNAESKDGIEGLTAFSEKRKPNFK